MEKYNYRSEMESDVRTWIFDNYSKEELLERLENDRDDFAQELNDAMWCADSVTGNASGSYTFNTWKAEENLCHNLDLLEEALEEFGGGEEAILDVLKKGAENCDVTIRCYLLGQVIEDVLDNIEYELDKSNRIPTFDDMLAEHSHNKHENY